MSVRSYNRVKILGTSIDSIDIAEDRDLFRKMMDQLGIPMPESGMATNIDEALACVKQIGGYPVMIRPSFVLGSRGMEVIYDEKKDFNLYELCSDEAENKTFN